MYMGEGTFSQVVSRMFDKAHILHTTSAFDLFQKVRFYLELYNKEVNLQTFGMI